MGLGTAIFLVGGLSPRGEGRLAVRPAPSLTPTASPVRFLPDSNLRRLLVAIGFTAAVAAASSATWGDIIRLKDGTTYEGSIRRKDGDWIVTLGDGHQVVVPSSKVQSLQAQRKPASDDSADRRLLSLRAATESQGDIPSAISRFQQFIDQYKGTPAAEQATADLRHWQERQDRQLVKVGAEWVSPERRQELAAEASELAVQAIEPMRQHRDQEAAALLDRAIVQNPESAAARYLRGVLYFHQNNAPEARKAFEKATSLDPKNAAALNDLAVVLWRQNQYVAALLSYEKAMIAAPSNRTILDNVAEGLSALREDMRSNQAVRRIVRVFNDQDAVLQGAMARQGFLRWGATWVSRDQMQSLQAAKEKVQAQLAQMDADFKAAATRIDELSRQIENAQATLRQLEASTLAYDSSGRVVRYPLPPLYYQIQLDIGRMEAEKSQKLADQEQRRKAAKALQQSLPTPPYTGVQKLIEWEGVAVPPAAAAPAGALPAAPASKTPVNGAPAVVTPPTGGAAGSPPAGAAVAPAADPAMPRQPAQTPQSPVAPAPTDSSPASSGVPAAPAPPATQPHRPGPRPPPEKPSLMDRF